MEFWQKYFRLFISTARHDFYKKPNEFEGLLITSILIFMVIVNFSYLRTFKCLNSQRMYSLYCEWNKKLSFKIFIIWTTVLFEVEKRNKNKDEWWNFNQDRRQSRKDDIRFAWQYFIHKADATQIFWKCIFFNPKIVWGILDLEENTPEAVTRRCP